MEIGIDLYRSSTDIRQGIQFDLGCIIMRLLQAFPEIAFEEEFFNKQIRAVERVMSNIPSGNARLIAKRDAEERGPGFRFRVNASIGSPLEGAVSRYCLSFRFDANLTPELKAKAEAFLDSFSLPRFKMD